MIDKHQLLTDLQKLLPRLEADLRARCDEVATLAAELQREYDEARAAKRAGGAFEEWRAERITQLAAAWVLSCVFVRFLEDNALITPPCLAGGVATGGMQRARDERDLYFRAHPTDSDRHYLLAQFEALAKLPGMKEVFGAHNPVADPQFRDWLSGDAAQALLAFFQKVDTDGSGDLVHDFADPTWDTRFLGDLYQDLSEAARKKYALLQTPEFIEEFILERTLEPAIREFGLANSKMIDPACGSGHFVLGGFRRILEHWRKAEPGANDREMVKRALAAVHGVDLNPYAVAIARFRLLLAAMRECQVTRLQDAPAFTFNLVCGDSLLHGAPGREQQVFSFHELAHVYQSEDIDELRRNLTPGQYQAVVANPPYITVKDKMLNEAYRERYPEVCHMKYSLSVPFLQRLFDLSCPNGFTGQITANSFMKREFGKKLIETYLPRVDLTHVIDTSGACIPGHGTPTVILFGRQRSPVIPTVRTVMSIKGEPVAPADPALGAVWRAIRQQVDMVGSQSAFVSIADTARDQFHHHPWSIGGGGAAELKGTIEACCTAPPVCLGVLAQDMGFVGISAADDVMIAEATSLRRAKVESCLLRPLVVGDDVRDWQACPKSTALFPYDANGLTLNRVDTGLYHRLWACRTVLWSRATFSKLTYREEGRTWWEWHQVALDRLRTPLTIVFGFVATHNHFGLDRGGKVFNRTAPVIKLRAGASEDDYLAILGLLNSSVACFWGRQTLFPRGGFAAGKWEERLEWDCTKLATFPLAAIKPLALAREIDQLASELIVLRPAVVLARQGTAGALQVLRDTLDKARLDHEQTLARMIALQEELDWECYHLYGLLPEGLRCVKPPPLHLGERAFEIILARKMAAGEEESAWFERHGSTPITALPVAWPADYRRVVEQRIAIISKDRNIGLIEQPESKRRWNTEPWAEQQARALTNWLLDRLESYFDLDGRMNAEKIVTAHATLQKPTLVSIAQVADIARADREFMVVAQFFTGRVDFEVANLVGNLITGESVPALPVLRYKPSGLDKHQAWERTWALQRMEDAVEGIIKGVSAKKPAGAEPARDRCRTILRKLGIPEASVESILAGIEEACHINARNPGMSQEGLDELLTPIVRKAQRTATGDIPVPPKYTSADLQKTCYYQLRGPLDVHQERWVSFQYCENEDGALMVGWAGYDHLQLATAIAGRYEDAKEREGRKLTPLLAAIGQLVPWLKQWHNELDPTHGLRLGDYYADYLATESKALGQTVAEVMAWQPPAAPTRGRKKA